MIGCLTGGALTANVRVGVVAGVAALQLDAGLVVGAIVVLCALGVTPCVWISQEVGGTGTLRSVIYGTAVSVLSTGPIRARRGTSVSNSITGLRLRTVTV